MTRRAVIAMFAAVVLAPAVYAGASTPLAGTTWRPAPLSGHAGTPDRPVFIKFGPAGRVNGYAGCNSFTGSYRQTGDTMVLGPLATTRMACAPDVMEREQWLLETLRQTRRIAVTAGELTLKTVQGATSLRLMPHQ